MQLFRWKRCASMVMTVGAMSLLATTLEASTTTTSSSVPVLLAKSWAIGYTLVFLAILLGLLAVVIPSMRKVLRKKEY